MTRLEPAAIRFTLECLQKSTIYWVTITLAKLQDGFKLSSKLYKTNVVGVLNLSTCQLSEWYVTVI